MLNFFKNLIIFTSKAFYSNPKSSKELDPPKELNVVDNRDNNNIDSDKIDDGGEILGLFEKNKENRYYPKSITSKHILRTRGYYKNNYPQGAVIHYTAGRSRTSNYGGRRNAKTHLEMGERSIIFATEQGTYAYFLIDRSGGVHQNFPIDRWGYHAGVSAWQGIDNTVSDKLVGIEVQGAGRLSNIYQNYEDGPKVICPVGKLAAWYTRPKSGDFFFDKKLECRYSEDNDNIQKGWYHAFSKEQEESLISLLFWLKSNNPDIFQFKYVLGHDEVSGKKGIGYNRKQDPGASLSFTMSEFRQKLEKDYQKYKFTLK